MGWLFKTDELSRAEEEVRTAENYVKQCQLILERQKESREHAKKNGNYRNSAKVYRVGNKVGTSYDYSVWHAEDALKKRKESLARAKKVLAEVKKKNKSKL